MAIQIVSPFTDYYDYLSVDGGMIYNRVRNTSSKVEELRIVKALGIKTLELKPANQIVMGSHNQKVVVYMDLSKHSGEGKMIYPLNTVKITYPNKLCSIFYEPSDGVVRTYKFLQIGKRRFWVYIRNKGLVEDTVEGITEIESGYNYYLRLPIYSIDYILTSDGLTQIAVDFNSIQSLSKLGMNRVLGAEVVVQEVYESILEYSKNN